LSLYTTIERHSPGGWPDGIAPGFIEHGANPTVSPGFQCPVASILKFGSTYYEKTGSSATAWTALPMIEPSPVTAKKQNEWYPWGGREYSDGAAGGEFGGGAGIRGTGAAGQMMAILAYFPEAITITALAAGLNGDTAGFQGFWALAPDVPVSGNHYPGSNVLASVTNITGGGTGLRKLRGQSGLSLAIPARSFQWAVFQSAVGFGAGAIWVAFDRREWPGLFGISSMSGLAVGGTLPASPISYASGLGYETPVASAPAPLSGVNFPAGITAFLPNSNTSLMWGNESAPYLFYQFTR
jgi:hypothetical protein